MGGGGMNHLTTRRNFVGGIASVIAAQSAPAVMIGLRGAMMASKVGGIVDPREIYDMTDCVWMLDGIYNTRAGQNLSSESWQDLSSTALDLPLGAHMSFDDTALLMRPTSTSDSDGGINDLSADALYAAIASSSWTLEVCYTGEALSSMLFQLVNYGYLMRNATALIVRFTTYRSISVSFGESVSCAVVYNGSGITLYHNGEQAGTAAGTASTETSGYLRINPTGNGARDIDFHAFRLYSRALTAAEIAANYAVDKRRFNLT